MIKTKVGELEVYDSGTIVNVSKEPITFSLGESNKFEVVFYFENDSDPNAKPRVSVNNLGNDRVGISFHLYNFNNVLGTGNSTPSRIGWIGGRSLLISYRGHSTGEGQGIVLHYTFFKGKLVDDEGREIE